MPVEFVSTRDWTIVVVANRDVRARRIAWAHAGAPACQGGIGPAKIEGRDATGANAVTLARDRRVALAYPKGDGPWPFDDGPTVLDVEEVRPEGTICHRVPVTGAEPQQQWRLDRRWVASAGLGGGLGRASDNSGAPIQLPWFVDLTIGFGGWLGPVRLDAGLLLGSLACTGCSGEGELVKAAVGVGGAIVAWQGVRRAIEVSAGYRRTSAFAGGTSLSFNGGRVGVAWGATPPPIVGLQWNSARFGFGGVELFAEWLDPTDARLSGHLMLGLGVVGRAAVF